MFCKERIATIFGNMEALYTFQSGFLKELEGSIDWQEPHKSCIGAVFIRNVSTTVCMLSCAALFVLVVSICLYFCFILHFPLGFTNFFATFIPSFSIITFTIFFLSSSSIFTYFSNLHFYFLYPQGLLLFSLPTSISLPFPFSSFCFFFSCFVFYLFLLIFHLTLFLFFSPPL